MKNYKTITQYLIMFITFFLPVSCETTNKQNSSEETENAQANITKKDTALAVTDSTVFDFSVGAKIYKEKCMVCHQENGKGIEGTFPPLANSDYLLADKERAIIQTITGSKKPIIVNGIEYPGNTMTTVPDLSNEEIAKVVSYVLNSWGNNGGIVTPEDVEKARAKIKDDF